jgi:hypothetical protein
MTSVNSTSQYLQQGLTNPEYSIVLRKTYPTKRKDSKDMLALREVVELEKESFAEKLYYKWILTFNILVQALTSILVKLIVVQFCTCSISITCIKHHISFPSFHFLSKVSYINYDAGQLIRVSITEDQRRFEPIIPSWGSLTTQHMQDSNLHISTFTRILQNVTGSSATREHNTPPIQPLATRIHATLAISPLPVRGRPFT